MIKRLFLTVLLFLLIIITGLHAADFEEDLQKLVEENGKSYVQPLLTGFGTAVNSGLYKKASVAPGKLIPIGFDIGVVTSAALVPDEDKSFEYVMNVPITVGNESIDINYSDLYTSPSQTTPTIASDKEGTTLHRKSDEEIVSVVNSRLDEHQIEPEDIEQVGIPESFSFPDGLNVQAVPYIALQANVRLPVVGIELTGRGFPEYEIKDVGKLSAYGVGLRKSLPVPVVDVTVGAFYQTMSIGDYFEVDNLNFHAEVGKSIGLPFLFNFSPYAGIGLDQTSGTLQYSLDTAELPGEESDPEIKYDFEGENKLRFTAGFTAQIIPLTYLNLEVAQGEYLSGTVSLGLIIK